jgi:LPXTG-motif cell wall-anchored protein
MRKISVLLAVGVVVAGSSFAALPRHANAQRIDRGYGFTHISDASGGYAYGAATATDGTGNVYVAGSFSGTVDFDPGAGTDNRTSAGGNDAFLTKYNADGSYGWTKAWGGASSDNATKLSVDANGNMFIAGVFSNTIDFNTGAGTDNRTSVGNTDISLTKYNADGSYGWTKAWGGASYDTPGGLAVDSTGNPFITGTFDGTVDFDPGAGTDNRTSVSLTDVSLTKYNADGSYGWTKAWGGVDNDYSSGLAIDGNNKVYIAGTFGSTVDFDPGAGTDNRTSEGSFDAYVSRYNADGSYGWTKAWGGVDNDTAKALKVDSNNNVYIAGMFETTADFDPGAGTDNRISEGGTDAFLTKYNADGSYGWTKAWGGAGSEYMDDLAIDSQNRIHVAFYNPSLTSDFDPGAGTDIKTTDGSGDFALATFTSNGTYAGALTWGGTSYEELYSVAIDANDNMYLVGEVDSTSIDFNPYAGTDTQTPSGSGDMFLTKLAATHYQNVTGLPAGLKLIDPATNKDMADAANGGTVRSSSTTLRLTTQAGVPIADATANTTVDRDWSGLTAASDAAGFKSVVSGLGSAAGVSGTHSLYVPKRAGDNTVYICPNAAVLADVSAACSNVKVYKAGDSNTSVVNINGQDYWKVTGLTGTGGISGNVSGTLANTGENSWSLGIIAVGIILFSGAGLVTITRRK